MPNRSIMSPLILAAALGLVLLGGSVSLGWWLWPRQVLEVMPVLRGLAPNAGLAFLLLGIAVLVRQRHPGRHAVAEVAATAVLALAGLTLGQSLFQWYPVWPELGLVLNVAGDQPVRVGWSGRMADGTAWGLALAALYLLVLPGQWRGMARGGLQTLLVLLFCITTVGLLGYLVHIPMFVDESVVPTRMSLPSALALMLASLALFGLSLAAPWFQSYYRDRLDRRVFALTSLVLLAVLLVGGVLGGAILARTGLETHRSVLETTLANHARQFEQERDEARALSGVIATLWGNDPDQGAMALRAFRDRAQGAALESIYLDRGFGGLRLLAGSSVNRPVLSLALDDDDTLWLLWDDGYHFEIRLPAGPGGETLAARLPAQALNRLDRLARTLGHSAEAVVCGRAGAVTWCFPTRHAGRAFSLPQRRNPDAELYPVERALGGASRVDVVREYRDQEVLAAYRPLVTQRLAAVLKADTAELYVPIRRALWQDILLISLLAFLGAALIHRFVRPLVAALARTESHLQAILDSVPTGVLTVDEAGRVRSMNRGAANLFGVEPEQAIGEEMTRLVADWGRLAGDPRALPEELRGFHELQGRRGDGGEFFLELGLRRFHFEDEERLVLVANDISQRKAMQAELQRVSRHTALLLRSAGEGIYGLDTLGRLTFINPAATRMLGYGESELLGRDMHQVLHHTHRDGRSYASAECPINATLRDGRVRHVEDELFWSKGGRGIDVAYVCAPIIEDDRIVGGVVMFSDVSQRKAAEQRLRQSESRYRLLADHATDLISSHTVDGTYLYASPASQTLLGYDPDDLVGHLDQEFVHPDDLANVRRALGQALRAEQATTVEYRIRRRNGDYLWVETTRQGILGLAPGNEPILVAVTRDITRRRQAEAALRRAEANLRRAQEVAHVGSWVLTAGRPLLEWSEETYRIFGLPPGQLMDYPAFMARVHPDDRGVVDAAWKAALAGQPYDVEHRILVAGQVRWVRERAELAFDPRGHLESAVGTVQDISELKEKELELLQSRQKLRDLAAHGEKVREEERAGIAREIHDELGQYLTALRMDAALLQISAGQGQLEPVAQRAEAMKKLIDQTIGVVRNVAAMLRPGALDLGLVSAAEWLVGEFRARTGLDCRLDVPADDLELDDALATTVFRMLQESLTNIMRHANARHLTVRIAREGDGLVLEVADDGVGFDAAVVAEKKTYGLLGIRERALMFGGEVRIDSAPGAGTTLRVRLPLGDRLP